MDELMATPWSLKPLQGKYYGTEIEDANGNVVMVIWKNHEDYQGNRLTEEQSRPSDRETIDEVYDNHYESQFAYEYALAIIRTMNGN